MAISSLGVGSGLDLSGLIDKLMAAEQQPLIALQKREASYNARISALGTLKSGLTSLQTAAQALVPKIGTSSSDHFASFSTTVGDATLATATAGVGAVAGSYQLTNIILARAEHIRKTGFNIPPATDGTGDGTLSVQIGSGTAVDIAVKGGATLATIAKSINAANAGLTATVISTGTDNYLAISANESGDGNNITITSSDNDGDAGTNLWSDFDYSSSSPNTWTQQQSPRSASVDIDGLTIPSASNTLSSTITGLTITLTKESVAGTTVSVSQDNTTNLTSALTSFIKAYNDTSTSVKSLTAYNATTEKAGALQGDATARGAQSQLRNALLTKAGGTSTYQTLSDIGISIQLDGSLKLDSDKLNAAIEADYTGVSKLAAAVGKAFDTAAENMIGTSGNIVSATESANRSIKALQISQDALEFRLTQIEARYTKQFTALDTLVANLTSTSSYLQQQLASLPGFSSSSSN